MSSPEEDLLAAFEGHDVDGVRSAIEAGADVKLPIKWKAPTTWLLREYTRSDRLPECLQLLLSSGATLDDPVLTPVLLNDAFAIKDAVKAQPAQLDHRTALDSSFTPLEGATLLHVAAEFGHFEAARALVELGADVNATAATDDYGLNGHTPLFHTVNSHQNRSEPIMRLLLDAGAEVNLRLAGVTWGKGYEWETSFFDVTPISYAQLGLMPQMHRKEVDIYANIRTLLNAAGRTMPPLANVPNRYLQQ